MRGRRLLLGFGVVVVAVLAVLIVLAQQRVGPPPAVTIETGLPAIGRSTPVRVHVEEPERGLSEIRVELVQDGQAVQIASEQHAPRPFWAFWGPAVTQRSLALNVGRDHQDWLEEGEATIRVTAARASTWLSAPAPVVVDETLAVRLRPPVLGKLSEAVYAAQGGSEAVVYTVGPTAVNHGVQAGPWWFPGYPLPGGGPGEHFSLFAVPYDMQDHAEVKLVAADDVGNTAQVSFIDRFFAKPLTTETIEVSEGFLAKVVPAILSQTPEVQDRGDPLQTYLAINGELRRRNNSTLVELAGRSQPIFRWKRAFLQMPNTKVMSSFADRRTYMHEGRVVDQQDHLGFDLASTKRAPVPAANDGVVMLARYFGIYGNAVVLDHGYGLMSLYGHLSSIAVKEGQQVARGEEVGLSGETGLAGGDHLHFTMLLHGLPVTPVEWWDAHWIQDRIARKLGEALPFEG